MVKTLAIVLMGVGMLLVFTEALPAKASNVAPRVAIEDSNSQGANVIGSLAVYGGTTGGSGGAGGGANGGGGGAGANGGGGGGGIKIGN